MAKSEMFRATAPLFIGVFRAHNPGDLVDGERVAKYGWQDRVEPVKATESGQSAAKKA